jgi:transposase
MDLIGIDLHTDSFYVVKTHSAASGVIRLEKKYALHGESWDVFSQSLHKEDYVLIEATTNAFWFCERIRPLVKECYVLNVNAVKFMGNKTDKLDAQRLLDVLSYYFHVKGIAELPSVFVPRVDVQNLRSLLSTYRLNKKIENQLKNRIYSLLKQVGVVTTKKKLFTKVGWGMALNGISEGLKLHVRLLRRQLTETMKTTESIKDLIIELGMKTFKEEVELLLSIPGFGVFSAIVVLADVANIDRFQSAKKFCAYLRTAPRIKESNSSTYLGRVTKQSRSMSCSVLTQSVLHFKHAGPHFSSFYDRIRTGKSAGKSRIALIRKMLVATYFMLKRHQLFRWVDKDQYLLKKTRIQSEVDKAMQHCRELWMCSQEEVA